MSLLWKKLDYFLESEPQIKYVDEIDQEIIVDYNGKMMTRGNRVTAINTRLRAVFTFLHYCFEQEYSAWKQNTFFRSADMQGNTKYNPTSNVPASLQPEKYLYLQR